MSLAFGLDGDDLDVTGVVLEDRVENLGPVVVKTPREHEVRCFFRASSLDLVVLQQFLLVLEQFDGEQPVSFHDEGVDRQKLNIIVIVGDDQAAVKVLQADLRTGVFSENSFNGLDCPFILFELHLRQHRVHDHLQSDVDVLFPLRQNSFNFGDKL